jgi:hypothetical protein
MLSFKGFLIGLSSVLSFGWPRKDQFSNWPDKAISEDWNRVGGDLQSAIAKFRVEKNND